MTQSTNESIQQMLPVFSTILSREVLQALLRKMSLRMYWRAYTPLIVLWGFIFQRLQEDHSCDNYVDYLHSGRADALDGADRHEQPLSWRLRSESNAGYVQGRQRLPLALLQEALHKVLEQIQGWLGTAGTWQGQAVRFLDGTTFSLRPLGDLAATYGHSSNQRGEHYWVQVRAVASFDLMSQAAVAVVEAPYAVGETSLVLPVLQADPQQRALYIGDRNFGVYRVLQAVQATAQEALFRLQKQQWQSLLQRNGLAALPPGESRRCIWQPSGKDKLLPDIPAPAIAGRLLYMRLEQDGFRPIDLYLFTTLLDETRYPLQELVALYAQRYRSAEVDFRHLKTTMHLDNLHVRSAAMFRKELLAACLAYNLVRAFMAHAALCSKQTVTALSFVQCKRRLTRALFDLLPRRCRPPQVAKHLLDRLAACRLPSTTNKVKHEPRRKRYKWRRYPPLTTDRQTARQQLLAHMKPCAIS
jgi:hypothetical protein